MDVHVAGDHHEGWDWEGLTAVSLRETRRVLGAASALSEDAAQEAVLRAWRRRAQCRTPGARTAWVAAIARREALRAVRAQQPDALPDEGPPVRDADLDRVELRVDVARALGRLDPAARRLLHARYWRDLTQEQAAAALGLPEGTAKVQLSRLRTHLSESLR